MKNKLQQMLSAIAKITLYLKSKIVNRYYNLFGNSTKQYVSNKLRKTDCGEEVGCECEKNIILDENLDSNNMTLDSKDYILANEIVDKIMKETIVGNIESKLIELCEPIKKENRKSFFIHLNTVFLNILLNRLDEFTPKTRENAILARNIINRLE